MTQEELKLVLDALETPSPMGQYKAITAIKEALAQEQEPVAWVVYSSAENDIVWADKGKRLKQNTPLYTTPPQRTWVGLTVNEIVLINADYPLPQGFAQAIEAKLKQKNGYTEEKNT